MPIYEYKCSRCGRRVEKIQSFKAEPLRECESCGGPLERLISPPAIQFKGSGWYVTDYARKGSSPAGNGKSGTEAQPEKASTGEAKTETPAKKTESKSD